MTRWIKWGVIALLVAAVSFLSYQWGKSVTGQEAEQRRREAVQEAVRAANAEAQERAGKAEKRAQALRERLERTEQELSVLDDRVADFEGGDELCLPPDALELYNSY